VSWPNWVPVGHARALDFNKNYVLPKVVSLMPISRNKPSATEQPVASPILEIVSCPYCHEDVVLSYYDTFMEYSDCPHCDVKFDLYPPSPRNTYNLHPPAPPLVGIEPNPGPTKKGKAKKTKKAKNVVVVAPIIKGSGDYKTHKNKLSNPQMMGSAARTGSEIGRVIGSGVDLVKKLFGFGDYKARNLALNAAYRKGGLGAMWETHMSNALAMSVDGANFATQKDSVFIAHTDYIGQISGTSVMTINPFPLTVTNNVTFPWLSGIAPYFQQYQIVGCIFEYSERSSNFATGSALGDVIFSTNYNPSAAAPADLQHFYNNEYTTAETPDKSFVHGIELKGDAVTIPLKYTVQGSGQDLSLVSYGNTYLTTVGNPSTNIIGEVFVHYMVKLLKPQLYVAPPSATLPSYNSVCTYNTQNGNYGTPVIGPYNYGITGTTSSNNYTLTFAEPGVYIVAQSIQLDSFISLGSTSAGPAVTSSSTGTTLNNFFVNGALAANESGAFASVGGSTGIADSGYISPTHPGGVNTATALFMFTVQTTIAASTVTFNNQQFSIFATYGCNTFAYKIPGASVDTSSSLSFPNVNKHMVVCPPSDIQSSSSSSSSVTTFRGPTTSHPSLPGVVKVAEHITTWGSPGTFFCQLCNVPLRDATVAFTHLQSSYHVSQLIKLSTTPNLVVETDEQTPAPVNSSRVSSTGSYAHEGDDLKSPHPSRTAKPCDGCSSSSSGCVKVTEPLVDIEDLGQSIHIPRSLLSSLVRTSAK
jgi:hypothetical protein